MISVIICTHNPNLGFFNRVIESLKQQDLPTTEWEIVVIDNASDSVVSEKFDFSWHPNVTQVIEQELGVIYARIRSCEVAKGDWYLFLDDDNVLFSNYLSTVQSIIAQRPYLGCFGGNQIGDFVDFEPNKHTFAYLTMIAVRKINQTRISNLYDWNTTPAGAGMIVRAGIMQQYLNHVLNDPNRRLLGRKGKQLMSSEDIDIAYTSIDMGYFNGLFSELSLYHIIPDYRLKDEYLIKLKYYNMYSTHLLNYIRFGRVPKKPSILSYGINKMNLLMKGSFLDRKIASAAYKATSQFLNDYKANHFNKCSA